MTFQRCPLPMDRALKKGRELAEKRAASRDPYCIAFQSFCITANHSANI